MPVIELTVVPPSLIESFAMCEWQSMMPGEMYSPEASMTSAPAGTSTLGPIAAILPSRRTIVPLGIVPLVTVTSVAPLSAMVPPRVDPWPRTRVVDNGANANNAATRTDQKATNRRVTIGLQTREQGDRSGEL